MFPPYPSAIAKAAACGSVSAIVPVTDIVLVTAFVDVLIWNISTSSEPSNNLNFKTFVVALSIKTLPATAVDGLELPMCIEFKACKDEFKFERKVPNAVLSSVNCETCDITSYILFLLSFQSYALSIKIESFVNNTITTIFENNVKACF